MWYLNVAQILSLFAVTALLYVWTLLPNPWARRLRQATLLVFCVVFLYVYSKPLALFYGAYTVANYVWFQAILRAKKGRRALFIASIVFNVAVLFLLRFVDPNLLQASWLTAVVLLGLIYNLLKAINTLYYAYYFERHVSFVQYAIYLLFIPTFTSGPILKLKEFHEDLNREHAPSAEGVEYAVKRIIRGLFKKIVLVAVLTLLYQYLLGGELNVWKSVAVLATYYILLFFDFSGYSDIAIGFGTLMGFRVPENFKKPFSSPTLTQFWRNWHATLGDWFRDHVFLPFSRGKTSRLFAGGMSFLIMLLVGLWHGFNWLFIGWGGYHGVLLLAENALGKTTVNRRKATKAYYWSRCLLTNALVAFGTIFFSPDLATARRIMQGLTRLG
jgi:alginate O-acetyltransferase complex protein AlgI